MEANTLIFWWLLGGSKRIYLLAQPNISRRPGNKEVGRAKAKGEVNGQEVTGTLQQIEIPANSAREAQVSPVLAVMVSIQEFVFWDRTPAVKIRAARPLSSLVETIAIGRIWLLRGALARVSQLKSIIPFLGADCS